MICLRSNDHEYIEVWVTICYFTQLAPNGKHLSRAFEEEQLAIQHVLRHRHKMVTRPNLYFAHFRNPYFRGIDFGSTT